MNRRTSMFSSRRAVWLGAAGFWIAALMVLAQSPDTNLLPLLTVPAPGATNSLRDPLAESNLVMQADTTNAPDAATPADLEKYRVELEQACNLVNKRKFDQAGKKLVELLAEKVPDVIRQPALLDLGAVVAAENDLPRAQSIYTQYLDRWPTDVRVPEILLRQGGVFRQMGLDNLALTKFYGVMTAALSLKNDQLDYYRQLVLQAQIEIAETYYQMGRYADAAEFYSRLLKQPANALNRPLMQFRLVRSLAATGRNEEAVAAAQDFLAHFPDDSEAPETRYYLAQALKAEGQPGEALRQVLAFLQAEKKSSQDHPEVWAYWQQRVGNEIANSLYKEGDYVKALEIYLSLAKLDSTPAWQLPVKYQIAITYEHLLQPERAVATYTEIIASESAVGTNATPDLQAVFEMARWRSGFIKWQDKAELANHSLSETASINSQSATNSTTP
jgi:tetratricopeptide (TPR) repeat protein